MDPNQSLIVIEGIEEILERDLDKHKALLERSQLEKQSFAQARAHEVQKRRAWREHIGEGKFSDEALEAALKQCTQNITMWSAKVKLSEDAIAHHTEIVDKLTVQLAEHYVALALLAQSRSNGDANPNRLD